ncbi:MAG: hypothetical protein JWM05_962 [Acidimicrobiales bacterium]|nr:hypothetical protein [Acidimicrobiales bacterium]
MPTFLVIGAMKAGTTTLWHYLRAHQQVFMPDDKELQFFSDRRRWAQGLDWYRDHFAGAGDALAVGEASTGYTKHPRPAGVAARIAEHLPDVRLVYVVRDPIERIRSHYLHSVHKQRERRPLADAVHHTPAYLAISRYRTQIDQYLAVFPPEQLLVITSESLRTDRITTLEQVFAFIGVDPSVAADLAGQELHRSADKRFDTKVSGAARRLPGYQVAARRLPAPLKRRYTGLTTRSLVDETDTEVSDALRAELVEALRPEVAGLRELLGPDFDGWGIT